MFYNSSSELSHAVNSEARRQYPEVAKLLGMSSLITIVAPRVALRLETEYPYSFRDDESLVPSCEESFGRIIKRNRREGLEEIHASIGTDQKEHGWLFIPSESIWVDTTLAADEANVSRDQYAHIFLSHLFPEVEAVHTHPDATVRMLAKEEPWSYSQNYLLEAAQPSTDDLVGHYMMVARTAPSSLQVSTVVSHHGATSFVLSDSSTNSLGFRTEAYDRLVRNPSDPVNAICEVLDRMRTHVLTWDDSPAVNIMFMPMH